MIILRITTVASNQEKQFSQMERIQKVGKEKDNFNFNEQQNVRILFNNKKSLIRLCLIL
jgi:hypothetical protein